MSAKPTAEIIYFPEPRDIEMEQAALGCLMYRNKDIEAVAAFLRPEHFSEPLHQRLFDAAIRLMKAGRDVSPVSLGTAFAEDPALANLGGTAYLVDMMRVPPSVLDAVGYGRGVHELAQRRSIGAIGKGLQDAAKDLPIDDNPETLVEAASAALIDLDLRRAKIETVTGGAAASLALASAWAASQSERPPGLSFGLEAIDAATGGAHPGDMIVVAGRPGMGKSAIACGIARNVATAGGGVIYISCEMTSEQLGRRLISDGCRDLGYSVPYQALRSGKIDMAMHAVAQQAEAHLREIPLLIDDRRKPPLPQLIASCRSAARKFQVAGQELKLIVIDHMQLVAAPREYKGNRVSEVTEISGEIKALARDLGVPIISCSQLNRELEGRDVKDKRPTLRDLRESGAIEQDADIVMLLYREEYYHLLRKPDRFSQPLAYEEWEPGYLQCKNKLEIAMAKNREGEPKTVTLHCDMSVSAIRTWRGHA